MPRRSSGAPNALKPFVGDNEKAIATISPTTGVTVPFTLIVTSAQLSFGTDYIDATGEMTGNLAGADVDDLKLLSLRRGVGQASISGFAKATSAIGLANLEDTDDNVVNVKFLIGIGQNSGAVEAEERYIKFRMAVERCNINFDVNQPFVGI